MIMVSMYDLVVDRYPVVHIHELLACWDLQVPEAWNLDIYGVIGIGDYEYDNGECVRPRCGSVPRGTHPRTPRL